MTDVAVCNTSMHFIHCEIYYYLRKRASISVNNYTVPSVIGRNALSDENNIYASLCFFVWFCLVYNTAINC